VKKEKKAEITRDMFRNIVKDIREYEKNTVRSVLNNPARDWEIILFGEEE
jgi:hypothetical protein